MVKRGAGEVGAGGGGRVGEVLVEWSCSQLGPKTVFSGGGEAAGSEAQLLGKRSYAEDHSQVAEGERKSQALGSCKIQPTVIMVTWATAGLVSPGVALRGANIH